MTFTVRQIGNEFILAGRQHRLREPLESLPGWIAFYAAQVKRLRAKRRDIIADTIYQRVETR